MVGEIEDPRRVEPQFVLNERKMLEGWLEFHRSTLLFKCEGLDGVALRARPVATSKLSLHGLVRHMADVERNWFTRVLMRVPETPGIFFELVVDDDREAELHWTYVASVERGERNISLVNIVKLADALGVDPGELLAGLRYSST